MRIGQQRAGHNLCLSHRFPNFESRVEVDGPVVATPQKFHTPTCYRRPDRRASFPRSFLAVAQGPRVHSTISKPRTSKFSLPIGEGTEKDRETRLLTLSPSFHSLSVAGCARPDGPAETPGARGHRPELDRRCDRRRRRLSSKDAPAKLVGAPTTPADRAPPSPGLAQTAEGGGAQTWGALSLSPANPFLACDEGNCGSSRRRRAPSSHRRRHSFLVVVCAANGSMCGWWDS